MKFTFISRRPHLCVCRGGLRLGRGYSQYILSFANRVMLQIRKLKQKKELENLQNYKWERTFDTIHLFSTSEDIFLNISTKKDKQKKTPTCNIKFEFHFITLLTFLQAQQKFFCQWYTDRATFLSFLRNLNVKHFLMGYSLTNSVLMYRKLTRKDHCCVWPSKRFLKYYN